MSEIVFNSPNAENSSVAVLKSQIENLQTTLASLNQQVIVLQEALQERDQEIADLKTELANKNTPYAGSKVGPCEAGTEKRTDNTLTIVGALINLYKYIFSPRKDTA